MSSKKSGGKSNGSNGSAGKSGGGGASQRSMAKSTPKPSSEGKSPGKPNSSVDTKSVRSTQENIKSSVSKAGNMSGVKLQDGAGDPSCNGPQCKGQKGDLCCENKAGVPPAEVKVKSSDLKSRGVGRDRTKEKLTEPKLKASSQ